MSKLGYSVTGYEIVDEEVTIPAGSGDPATVKVSLAHDTLIADGLSVTVDGTPLIMGADYDLLREDYSVRYQCYRAITFYSHFETTALVTYTTLGDYIEAGDLNSIDERLLAIDTAFYGPGELIDRIEDLEDDMYDAVDGIKPRTEDVYNHIFAPVSGKKDVMDDIQPFITNEVENFTENYMSAGAVAQLPQDCKHGVGTAGVVSGRTWINVLGTTGANIAASGTVAFTSVNGHIYYDVLNNSKITGDGGSKTITNSGSSAANVMVIDLTALGALMPEEAATATTLDGVNAYSVENSWEELPEAVLAQMTPTYIGGMGSANVLNGVVVDLQILAYSPSEDEVHASESVGAVWDSSSASPELLTGAIVKYPVLGREYPLLSLNGYRNEYQPDERMFVKRIALGDVTITAGSGTFTGAVGTGNCRLYSTSNWKAYSGTVSGNTVTTTAADGTYLLEYQLEIEQILGTPATEITVLESGTLTPVTVEISDVGIYIDGAVTIEVTERPIVEMVACSRIDLETGNLLNVLDKVTVAANGLSFTVEGAEAGDYFDYTYTHATVNNLPLIMAMGIPLSFHGRLTNLNADTSTTQKLLRDMSRAIMALGQFVQTYIPEARTVLAYSPTPIVHHGFLQEPDITIYGQTILNEISRRENFKTDTDSDGFADGYYASEGLNAELTDGEQRIFAEEVNTSEELIFSIEEKLIAGHKYLVYLEGKANAAGVLDATLTVTNGVSTVQADPWTETDTDFTRRFLTFTPESTADWALKVVTGNTASTPIDYTFRNLDMIDLTNLGEMNAAMQEVFGATNWYDLTDEQLEEYFDAVGHIDTVKAVGYTFDGGKRTFSINNYGETLDSTPISTVEVDTELHGWNGVYDAFNSDQKTVNVKRLELQNATIGNIYKSGNATYVEIETEETGANHAFIINSSGDIYANTNDGSEVAVEWDSSSDSPILTRL